jgi:signal peptidase I
MTRISRYFVDKGRRLEEFPAEQVPPVESTHSVGEERVSLARAFGGRSLLREILETVLLTGVLFLIINTVTGRSQVNGSSMEPTLHNGQYLIITRITYWIRAPERGDIIVFHPPNNLGEDYIKRIVGLPGERVEIRQGKVWADGVALDEPYVSRASSDSKSWTLGDGEYLVFGDNRNDSSDSRNWGPLEEESIVGKAWLSYWPPERWGIVKHHAFPEVGE